MREVAESDVAGFLAALRQGDDDHPPLSATSAARAVVAVRGLHRFALLDGLVPDDVAHEVRPPTPARRLPKAVPVESVVALIEAAGHGRGAARAARPGAAGTALRHRRAHLRGGRAGRRRPRPRSGRRSGWPARAARSAIVPVGSYALRAVEEYLVRARPALAANGRAGVRGGALFLNVRGGALSRQSAWAILRSAAERAGLTAGDLAAHAAALLRHPPARRRRRRPRGAGTARPRLGDDHAGLHAGHRRPAPRGLRDQPPAGAQLTSVRPRPWQDLQPIRLVQSHPLSVVAMSTCRPACLLGKGFATP